MRNMLVITAIVLSLLACATPMKHQVRQQLPQSKDVIGLEVNGEVWLSVPSFNESAAGDKHYVLREEDDSATVIVFGDGNHGARLPSDTKEVKVRYRVGRGYAGVVNQQGRTQLDGDVNCK